MKIFLKDNMGWTVLPFGENFLKTQYGLNSIVFSSKFFSKDNMSWTIFSFGENFLKRQYGLNCIVFWSKFSIRTIWDEPYSLLVKIFQKDYFLLYPGFNSSVRSNFPRQYSSCADKTVQVVQMDNTVLHRTVMSLESYCLAIRYQSSKTKRYKARHYGSEEITDIIFPRIIRNRNIARPRGTLDE